MGLFLCYEIFIYVQVHNWFVFGLQVQAFDFRTTVRNEPFLQLFHCLYVYPLTVSLSRKRNLFIRIELRKDDADIRKQPLEVGDICRILYKYTSCKSLPYKIEIFFN